MSSAVEGRRPDAAVQLAPGRFRTASKAEPGDRRPEQRREVAVTLVATVGSRSLDSYSQALARHLRVPTIETDVYDRAAGLFNARFLSRGAALALRTDFDFVRRLRRVRGALHFPNQHLARYGRWLRTPYLVTVHDLIRYFDSLGHEPLIHRPNRRDSLYLGLDYAGIRRARAVIAISETTRRDLIEQLGVPEDRVFVVYNGIDHRRFFPVPGRLIDEPYVLFVGSEQPRKNLRGLLEAFKLLKSDRRFADLKLVKVGSPGRPERPFRERTLRAIANLGLEGEVILTERVPDHELRAWYSAAECLVLPSLYEGFGFPPLEAMACGCPVIVSSAGALPEVAGDAALVVDPDDRGALAGALTTLLTDDAARRGLIARGLTRARRFTWERAAHETRRVYEAVAAEG